MAPSDNHILDRVRKLLAVAEHPNTPPAEAEAMSEKAAELMARYALDAALLESEQPSHAAPQRRVITVVTPYAVPKAVLLANVASPYRVRTAIGHAHEGRACTLIGFRADLDVVELLFTSLLLQATTAMLTASPGGRRVRAFRRAFLLGYAATIGRRLREAHDRTVAATAAATSAALVLASREAEVDSAFAEAFPRLGTLRTTMSDPSGMVAGQHAGSRADLSAGRRRVGDRRPAIGEG